MKYKPLFLAIRIIVASLCFTLSSTSLASPVSLSTLKWPTASELSNGQASIKGHSILGTQLQLLINDKPVGKSVTAYKSYWEIPLEVKNSGPIKLQLQQIGTDNNWQSTEHVVTIPAAPTITFPEHLHNYRGNHLQITGTGLANTDIALQLNGQTITTVATNSKGLWQYLFPVTSGHYIFQAEYPRSFIKALQQIMITVKAPKQDNSEPCEYGFDLGSHYLVGSCGNFLNISKRLQISPKSLLLANGDLADQNHLTPGQLVRLPPRTLAPRCGTVGYVDDDVYVMGSCDSLWFIADKLNIPLVALKANNYQLIDQEHQLPVGQLIKLP